ncbi:hypothetical protein HY969_03535 [Candidatus Kaiserbacteria bacterium]|nr:hypothetical protein [Candidatus Kaiserbacteria bacterium]
MEARRLLFVQFTLLAVIAFLYFLGFWLYLHWVFWWYDILLHFLGGVWVALAARWIFALKGIVPPGSWILALVIVVGLLWELFEVVVGMPRESNYLFDTSLDLLMDVLGSIAALMFLGSARGGEKGALPR